LGRDKQGREILTFIPGIGYALYRFAPLTAPSNPDGIDAGHLAVYMTDHAYLDVHSERLQSVLGSRITIMDSI